MTIPHWAPPTHAMQIMSYAETGSIGFLWISATNPAVSMPESARIRKILAGDQCFTVVQDLFLTETAELADVVLPAAGWGEKTGCFTNVNRAVHLSETGRRATGRGTQRPRHLPDVRRRDGLHRPRRRPRWSSGAPRRRHSTPGPRVTAGRPVDYTGLSYDKLRGPSGIPWPVNAEHPDGTDRLYADGVFPTDTDYCETYGHDLLTGGTVSEQEHRAHGTRPAVPSSRAPPYTPAHEEPSDDYPLLFTTGRTVYQFHTRTKTGRARSLNQAAPDAWVELSPADADRARHRRGRLGAGRVPPRRHRGARPHRTGDAGRGVRAVPLRTLGPRRPRPTDADHRTANELTMTVWDPVSKQPSFKTAACRVTRLRAGDGPAPAPTNTASAPASSAADDAAGARCHRPAVAPRPRAGCSNETPRYALDPSQEDS